MSPELARNLDDDLALAPDQREDEEELSETPRKFEDPEAKALSHEDRERFRSGKISLHDIKKESEQVKDQAENLIQMALGQEKISEKEAKEYRKRLNISQRKGEREHIVEDLQEAIAKIQTTEDKTEELSRTNPELQKAYRQYDRLIDENGHLLGKQPAEEYKKWIREQKSSIANVEELTVAFFQKERPPRIEVFNDLKATLAKYGTTNPLDIPFIAREGLSERRVFLKNIQTLEEHFRKMGGVKDTLYSRDSIRSLFTQVCKAKTPQDQERLLLQAENLERDESKGYTTLEAATRSDKISQKSMDNIVDYYKTIGRFDKRQENLKLWDSFVGNEAKLADDLKKVFDTEPKNEEGHALAFKTFRRLDYLGKEKFIKEQQQKRQQEITEEQHNKELAIQAFKQECAEASRNKTISGTTEKNYTRWIDENAKGKTSKQVKEYLEILTSPQASDQYKNLKAYERRRKNFKTELRKLRDVNPLLTEEEIQEWQDRYDEEGWKKRDQIAGDLKKEIEKALKARTKTRTQKADIEEKEKKEKSPLSEKNKETAIKAIQGLLKLKAYGSAMKRCVELLRDNPYDEETLSLMDEIAKFADKGSVKADPEAQKDIYDKYAATAERMLENDTEIKEDSDEIQTQEQALRLAKKDQEQRKKIKAKDRNKEEVMNKVKHDEELSSYAEEYMKESEGDEIIDTETLKGKEVVELDFDTEDTKQEKKTLRKQIRQERDRVGHYQGSTVIDFKQAKTGRTMDARSGQETEKAQQKEKEALAEEMALDIAKIIHPEGNPTPDQLARAKEAALAKLDKKAKTKIERMNE